VTQVSRTLKSVTSKADGTERKGPGVPLQTRPATERATIDIDGAGVEDFAVVPWPLLLRRRIARKVGIDRRWALLVVVLSGLFTVSFSITLLVITLSDMAIEFNSTVATMSWCITGPMLAFGVVGPAYGKAGDLWGHKRVFVGGLLGAGLFAALTAVSWNAESMIAFRILSASAGAATGPSTMAYINRLFAPEDRVKPLSYWSFVNAGAPVIGVVAGATLVDSVGWRAIFVVQAPFCLFGAIVAIWLLPDTERADSVKFDVLGSLTLAVASSSLLAAISQGSSWGWTSLATLGCFTLAAIGLRAFVAVEARAEAPLLPLSWFRSRNIAVPILSQSMANFAYMGGFLFAPRVLENLLGMSRSEIGHVVISRPLTFAVFAPIAGYITIRVGERIMGVTGALLIASSMLVFATVDAGTSVTIVVVALMLSGLGVGGSSPALTSTVANAVNDADLGVAGAVQQLSNQMGAVFGSVVMTAVQQAREPFGLARSYHLAFIVAAGAAVGAASAACFIRPLQRDDVTQ
jgi:MFS family permease